MASEHEAVLSVRCRTLVDAEQDFVARLDAAQLRLDAAMRASWESCLIGAVADDTLRESCVAALHEVERLERELVALRTARQGAAGMRDSAA